MEATGSERVSDGKAPGWRQGLVDLYLGSGILLAGLVWLTPWAGGQAPPAFPGVMLGIGCVALALMIGVLRIFFYGVTIAALGALATYMGVDPGPYMIFSGAAIAAVGVVLRSRSLRSRSEGHELRE